MHSLIKSAVALIATISFSAVTFAADRPAWYPPDDAVKAAVAKRSAIEQAERAWYQREIVAQYEKNSRRSPAWDNLVRKALDHYIEYRINPGKSAQATVFATMNELVALRCEDPLFLTMQLRNMASEGPAARQRLAGPTIEFNQQLLNQGYTGTLKFISLCRLAVGKALLRGGTPGEQEIAACERLMAEAIDELKLIARDQDLPTDVFCWILDNAHEASNAVYKDSWKWTEQVYNELEKLLPNRKAELLAAKGDFFVDYAWEARGSGWAYTVTEDGWKKMRERLVVAEQACMESWELDQTCLLAPMVMMTVELGQGKGLDVLDTWFRRAVALDPHDPNVFSRRSKYLEPKWHGSEVTMLAFAREVATTLPRSEQARLELLYSHAEIATRNVTRRGEAGEAIAKYAQTHPEAWPEIRAVTNDLLEAGTIGPHARVTAAMFAIGALDRETAARYVEGIPELVGQAVYGPPDYEWLLSQLGED